MADYEPPPRFPWWEFPEQDNEKQSENQQARTTLFGWLKNFFGLG